MRVRQSTGPDAARYPTHRASASSTGYKATRAAATSASQTSSSEWERFLAPFRPEARALFNLMIEVYCRLAGEAYHAYLASQADQLQQRKQRKQQEGQR